MSKPIFVAVLCTAIMSFTLCLPTPASAQRLDDSASSQRSVSPIRTVLTPARGASDGFNTPPPSHATLYFGRINYRLSTAQYVGKRARIYMVIPLATHIVNSPSGIKLEWRSARLFASGAGRPGDRVPVWQGTVPGAWLNEELDLTMQIELNRLQNGGARTSSGFESYFEIEVLQ